MADLPTPDYQRGDVRLYCGDCLDLLPRLPEGCVDAVVVDIPYNEVNRESGGLRNLDKGAADKSTFSIQFVTNQSARISVGSVYVWCGIEQVSEIRSRFVGFGMTTRLGGWEKSNPSPMNGRRLWLSSFECCVFARHTKAYFSRHCASPIWRGPIERDQEHPTQKPLWLIREQVEASVSSGGGALDFCMGSGTTGVACVQLGRAFIGIEKEPKYFDIACKRIDEAFEGQALFEPTERVEEQTELFKEQ